MAEKPQAPLKPGDPIDIYWEMLSDVPGVVLKLYSAKGLILAGIDPLELEALEVEREGYFRIHPRTKLVHLVLKPGEYKLNRTRYFHGLR